MLIHQNFVGGNIVIKEQTLNTFVLDNELRDTTEDWFYWAFCVENAENKTLTFKLQNNRLGYFGPAVSHDLIILPKTKARFILPIVCFTTPTVFLHLPINTILSSLNFARVIKAVVFRV